MVTKVISSYPEIIKSETASMIPEEAKPVDMNEAKIAKAVRSMLWTAQTEKRVTAGLSEAAEALLERSAEALFCVIAPTKKDDCEAHMQEVLLRAFCYEHDIYIIQVDNGQKLSKLLGAQTKHIGCAIIFSKVNEATGEEIFTAPEEALIDFCNDHWDDAQEPIVKIPDK